MSSLEFAVQNAILISVIRLPSSEHLYCRIHLALLSLTMHDKVVDVSLSEIYEPLSVFKNRGCELMKETN